jgi:hypothetical protein
MGAQPCGSKGNRYGEQASAAWAQLQVESWAKRARTDIDGQRVPKPYAMHPHFRLQAALLASQSGF